MSDEEKKADDEGVIIDAYTRAQALADGVLVDVTETAKRLGVKAPVALTRAVWERYVELTPAAKKLWGSEAARLWDILWHFACAATENPDEEILYTLRVITHSVQPSLVELKAIIGPGDDGETVITILLPEED